MNMFKVGSVGAAAGGVALLLALGTGCGGTGGGTGGASSTTTASTTSSMAGTGGMGTGGGGTGGTGTGGTAGACLDPSTYAGTFTVSDPTLCAVAVYQADEALGFQAPSWGSHGGPLTLVADATGGGVTLERWTVPGGAMGKLVKQETHVAAGVPMGAYLGGQANDLPFFGWTAISWTGPGASTLGDIAMIQGGAVAATYTANGPYAMVGIPGGSQEGRLLYTGLSPIGAGSTNTNGLYAADACASPKQDLGAGTTCGTPELVSSWGENSGPVAVDRDGNAFSVLTTASKGTQEARGFAAAQVARGAGPVPGTTLFTIPGYGGSLAAVTPAAGAPGLLVFQPFDATTFAALDVIAQRYTTTGGVAAMGAPTKLLTVPPMTMTGLGFFTDGVDRLWVAVPGTSSTTYVVLARAP